MNGRRAVPIYIPRGEEEAIKRELQTVQADGTSRVVLLYGDGGVGKTSLVRHMAEAAVDDGTVWVQPIDVDDPEIWLLSNLESRVASQLDRGNHYFAEYRQRLSRLPGAAMAGISHETIISHLNRLRDVFARRYLDYVTSENKTVVIVFDTVETIRGTNLARTLTQWMKALSKNTLFILSGRPPAGGRDQLEAELDSRYRGMAVVSVQVRGFSSPHAADYLGHSGISARLTGDEEEALVLLSRGHPLWLAFLVDYLSTEGVPPEVTRYPLTDLRRHLPFDGDMTEEGRRLHGDFLRRLVDPYQEADFWHEAIKRLAVMRQPVERRVWQRLMGDRAQQAGVDLDAAWDEMLRRPWIRPRANGQFLTLHDAVAEEFARRLFPLHDQDQVWRHEIWAKALGIYHDLAAAAEPEVEQLEAGLGEELEHARVARPADDAEAAVREAALISRSVELDKRRRQLDQLRAASLYYTFLNEWETGSERLLDAYEQAGKRNDSFFQDLLVLYLDRFLPGRVSSEALNDVIALKLDSFRDWLDHAGRRFYVPLGLMVGSYLIDSSQAEEALEFLAGLPDDAASALERHRLYLLRGNACLRARGKAKNAIDYFNRAVEHANALPPDRPDRHKLIAEAYKELGFYYRNTGEWRSADESYAHAWQTLVGTLSTDEDREELASIQTNWAYIKGLGGSYAEGTHLAQTAAGTRRRLNKPAGEGLSWSVCGEVHRYARRYEMAWRAYADAERLLTEDRQYWDRLGFVYQEQAICLYQATRDEIAILKDKTKDPTVEAERLVQTALELCLEYAIRAYPSALNRAGRIVGVRNADAGLKYLEEGISEAERLSDGWFWCANLVEYAELSYREWAARNEEPRYRGNIDQRSAEIDRVLANYSFPDLKGRWSLLKGHLAARDYGRTNDAGKLDEALAYYENGFADLATRHVGSSGAASLNAEFAVFEAIFSVLPERVRADWLSRLRSTWAATEGEASMLLLAHLEELVIRPAG
jgi:energy-coupling factor transporter ATP-binding protein EcfA2